MNTDRPAVLAEGLVKCYGDTRALDGFDLTVRAGTVCGLLGHNGAGKTTAVRILTTLMRADGGRAEVLGMDVARQARQIRSHIGVIGQAAAVDDILTGRDNLVMFGRLYHLGKRVARQRADELLGIFGLSDVAGRPVKTYSGGMRRRLDLAASLIVAPRLLFLDEPTTGLDPVNRNLLWDHLRGLVRGGTTVLLTTQYLDEADQLADKLVLISKGRGIAEGTPDELKSQIGGNRIDVVLRDVSRLPAAAAILARVSGAEPTAAPEHRRLSVPVIDDRVVTLSAALRELQIAGIDAEDIGLRRPTLDEVFLQLTGTGPVRETVPSSEPVGAAR
ncbi:daunorubicin resistance protein DrrA family ABC transporter ATP-binding protein [Virgisporangium ochraceum]|uniref:Daunorubicin resistance protein DrrA family ABC transporter ATP-binding protein n=1 Tax=Virgisporangium ochraceum TaxID=65505 RepID=A0A8J4A4K8_9ACTN|nr:ATP-binding cassette domain-containing protein [Virgisporangium ochraceum]GIJ75031.1 daunorubicin resistance protein DrrA family ABC transporter ATP-binding protein [Virgisporangium ochraceum]